MSSKISTDVEPAGWKVKSKPSLMNQFLTLLYWYFNSAKPNTHGSIFINGIQGKGAIQKLGQSFNSKGIALFLKVALSDKQLAMPHLDVPDLRSVHWAALREAGFEGCVFDKDNTLTEPYALEIHPFAVDALAECMKEFNGKVVLYSNSAGLLQFDPDGMYMFLNIHAW